MATSAQLIQKLSRLQSTLLTSGLQQSNQPLYQVINQLIKTLAETLESIVVDVDDASGGGTVGGSETFLTVGNELATLPNSSQLVAGDNISFDTSVFGQLRIDAPDAEFVEWSVLTNGDPVAPELIFDGDGDVIMLHTP